MAEHSVHHEAADLYRLRSGARLHRHRKRMGLTTYALAEKAGLGRSMLIRYEAGVEPPAERKAMLAHALDVSPDDIWHWHEDDSR
jgi:transcriptional regulator with XRE-family HTH domain